MKSPVCKCHGKPFVTFCKPCQKPCCAICIAEKHDRHSFMNIDDAAKDARSKLKICLQSQDTTELSSMQTNRKLIDDGIKEYNEAMECALEKSKIRFKSLHQQLERTEEDWIRNLEKTRADDVAKMDIMKGNIDNQIRRKTQFIDNCQTILGESDDAMVLAFVSDINDTGNLDSSTILLPSPVYFKASSRNLLSVDDLIGKLQRTGKRTPAQRSFYGSITIGIVLLFISIAVRPFEKAFNADRIEFKTVKTIENTRGDAIVHTAQNEVWISDQQSETLSLYDSDFNKIANIYLEFEISDIVLTISDDILATIWEEQEVLRISRSGNIKTFIDTSQYHPYGITIIDKDEIVVGQHAYLTDQGNVFKLAIYSMVTSMALREISTDVNGQPLFRETIVQVKQNRNGDYVVSHKNRVVCVTSLGEYRWKYTTTGETSIWGLVCDKYNNIIIAEGQNRQITILNSDGILLKTLRTEDSDWGPISLSLDRDENLWVGYAKYIKVIKYLE